MDATSINPTIPRVELIINLLRSVPALPKSLWKIWFINLFGSFKFPRKFDIGMRINSGTYAPYTLEEGLIAYLSSPLLNSWVVRLMFSIGSYGSCSKNPWAKIAEFKSTAARNTITHDINRIIVYLTYRSILIKKRK